MVAPIMQLDRKLTQYISTQQKNIMKLEYSPLQSPYTRVYGKREVYDFFKNPQVINNTSSNTPSTSQNICNKKTWINHSYGTPNLAQSTNTITCMKKMTGQGSGKGAARDLTEDPDFTMLEANSPPQGQKQLGGGKASSGEKRKASSSEKRSKPTSKDKTPPIQHFWLGFDTMEKLALE